MSVESLWIAREERLGLGLTSHTADTGTAAFAQSTVQYEAGEARAAACKFNRAQRHVV